jgi:hypothetical protein
VQVVHAVAELGAGARVDADELPRVGVGEGLGVIIVITVSF